MVKYKYKENKLIQRIKELEAELRDCKFDMCKQCRRQHIFDPNWCKECR